MSGGPAAVTYTPKFAYLVDAGLAANNISAYNVAPATGALTPVTGSPFTLSGSTSPSWLAVDTAGSMPT